MNYSFEVFPPKDTDPATLDRLASALAALDPDFVSVTYGAGGSGRHRSFDLIDQVVATGTAVAGHLTCVGQSRSDVDAVIDRYLALGVDQIVALRGDPPTGIDAPYEPHPDGYTSTAELVAAAKRIGVDQVSVSAYPEVHPQSPSIAHDLGILAAKADAGADRAITQMCFDTELIVRYVERVHAAGIDVDVVPGIMPIHSLPAISRFAAGCGATIPDSVRARFTGVEDDPDTSKKIGAEYAAEQIDALAERGIDRVHIYTLNRASIASAVIDQLQRSPATQAAPGRSLRWRSGPSHQYSHQYSEER